MAKVDLFEASGMTRSSAVASVAGMEAVSRSTLWNWQRLIDGVAASDRLPNLAPRRQGGGKEAEIDPDTWPFLGSASLCPDRNGVVWGKLVYLRVDLGVCLRIKKKKK